MRRTIGVQRGSEVSREGGVEQEKGAKLSHYNLSKLQSQTDLVIQTSIPPSAGSGPMPIRLITALESNPLYWLPLFSIKCLEASTFPSKQDQRLLSASLTVRCTLLGHLLWHIW
jgi:hypothetical protein